MSDERLRICYHGTTAEAAEIIRREGFREYTYFARNLQDALGFGGPHILEVVFSKKEIEDYGWQFKWPGKVPPEHIVRYYTLDKTLIEENEDLGRKVFESNLNPVPEEPAKEPSVDAWIDEIFNWAGDLFLEGNFGPVDEALGEMEPSNIGLTLSVTWLVVTAPAKEKLKNRPAFFQKVRALAKVTKTSKEAKSILQGLE